jgi:hypothetical protein
LVGGAECSEDEAIEWLARIWNVVNLERATHIMKGIKKKMKDD